MIWKYLDWRNRRGYGPNTCGFTPMEALEIFGSEFWLSAETADADELLTSKLSFEDRLL